MSVPQIHLFLFYTELLRIKFLWLKQCLLAALAMRVLHIGHGLKVRGLCCVLGGSNWAGRNFFGGAVLFGEKFVGLASRRKNFYL